MHLNPPHRRLNRLDVRPSLRVFITTEWDLWLSSDQTIPVFLRFPSVQISNKNVMHRVFPIWSICLCYPGIVKVLFYCGDPFHCYSFSLQFSQYSTVCLVSLVGPILLCDYKTYVFFSSCQNIDHMSVYSSISFISMPIMYTFLEKY